ncbi:ubiquitin domain-containing protein DSK2, putative [Plasmodium relictum]|uniref:Ubiquitin domain-containing protein DSK2, putative n=1 Tax=Plasmodium relictum TaxID=85471 RepID=A0A1J1H8T5_PLARL|nr:ubiquitin domain-containing protein DSK2, putative [Plasmodium relictum]CRH00005.1 ubiquitin domain-containing protein DSK2, putative [Plasmodium relictum]
MVINVSFKVTGGKEFTIEIEPNITVLDLKKKCSEHVDIPVEAQRIIFKGKILKDKESLSTYNVSDGNTMHLVRSAMPTKEPEEEKENNKNEDSNNQNSNSNDNLSDLSDNPLVQMLLQSGTGDMNSFNSDSGNGDNLNFGNFANLLNSNGGEFNRDTISSLLNNPLARSLLNELSNNPEMLTNLVSNNPILRNTFSQSPIMQPVLENPNLLREFMRPEILRAGLQIENALNMNTNNNSNQRGIRMEDLLNNLNNFANTNGTANNTDNNNSNENNNNNNNINSLFQSQELLQTFQQVMRANRNLANLNFPNSNQNLDFNSSNVTDNRSPEEKYASQLLSLQEMGFIDNAANIQALQETGGDVNSAVTRLLEKGFN